MAAQVDPSPGPPSAGQRTHWYEKLVGLPLQVPCVAVSVEPTVVLPLITGSAVFVGAACASAWAEPLASQAAAARTRPTAPTTRRMRGRPCSGVADVVRSLIGSPSGR